MGFTEHKPPPRDIRLLAVDLDGTALDERSRMTEATRNALRAASERGVEIVVGTGRVRCEIGRYTDPLPFVRYAICGNGASLVTLPQGEILYGETLSDEIVRQVLDTIPRYDLLVQVYIGGNAYIERRGFERMAYYRADTLSTLLKDNYIQVKSAAALLRDKPGARVDKFNFFFPSDEVARAFAAEFASSGVRLSTSMHGNLDINSPLASKGRALRALCDRLDIPRAAVMAVGDGDNDIELLEVAGWGVAMANGCAEIFPVADAVCPSNRENGLAQAVDRYILQPSGRAD